MKRIQTLIKVTARTRAILISPGEKLLFRSHDKEAKESICSNLAPSEI